MILCFPQWHIFQKWGVFQQSKGWDHGKFSRGKPPDARFFNRFARVSFQPPNVNFVPTVIESSFKPLPNVLSIFCSLSVFRMALLFFCFFAQIFGQSMHLRCSYVSRDHDHLSYGGAQICKFSHLRTQILLCCFVANHLGVQLTTQPKISDVHLPYFPYWLAVGFLPFAQE